MSPHPDPPRLRVVLLDEDASVAEQLRAEFTAAAVELLEARDPDALARLHVRGRTDAILMEPALGAHDGWEVCRGLRRQGDDTPLIMLSRRTSDVDRIVGLEVGADDYIVKPFNPREVLARLHAVLRRRPKPEPPGSPSRSAEVIHFGPYAFDLRRRELRKGQQPLPLTTGEYAMLKALVRHPGQALSRDQLAQMARGRRFASSTKLSNLLSLFLRVPF